MKRTIPTIALCIFVLASLSTGCRSRQTTNAGSHLTFQLPTFPIRYAAPKPAPPRYGWRPLASNEVELQALGYETFNLPHNGVIRVSVSADSGVFGGAFERNGVQSYFQARRNLRQNDFATAPCALVAVIRGATECRLDDDNALVYVVRDKRSELAMLGGSFFALHGATKELQRATDPNRVNVEIDVWSCVSNCPVQPETPLPDAVGSGDASATESTTP